LYRKENKGLNSENKKILNKEMVKIEKNGRN